MAYIKVLKAPNFSGKWEEINSIVKCKDCGEYPTLMLLEDGKCKVGCPHEFMKVDAPIHDSAAGAITWWNVKNTKKNEENTEKPSLGIKPSWLYAEERIRELVRAIERYSNHLENEENINHIRAWAMEIGSQCDIIEFIDKV